MKHKKKHNFGSIAVFMFTVICLLGVGLTLIRSSGNSGLPHISFMSESSTPDQPWNLILVNDKNSIPKNYHFELTELDNGRRVDSRIYPDLQAMFDDMRSSGIYPTIGEGFRTADEQQQMMSDKIDAYMNDGYSKGDAKKLAKQAVAAVGYSEHQIGLAVDINADESGSSDEAVYVWLAENSYKYGFIQRYPADKADITGIEYEPWHYRYVGKEAAEEIYTQGICLEEYLKNHTM